MVSNLTDDSPKSFSRTNKLKEVHMKAEILGTQNNKTQAKVYLEKEMKGNRRMVLQLKKDM